MPLWKRLWVLASTVSCRTEYTTCLILPPCNSCQHPSGTVATFPPIVFLLPDCSNLQSSIACRLTECRRRHRGSAQQRISEPFFVPSVWGPEAQALARHINNVRHSQHQDSPTWNGNDYSWVPPPMHLPSVYLTSWWPHVTKSPRPSPSIFAHCKRLKMKVGTAWEYSYINWVSKLSGPNFVWKCYNFLWNFSTVCTVLWIPELEPIQVSCDGFEWYA